MIVASGFVEVRGLNNVERIIRELTGRGVSIDEVQTERILFLIKRETVDMVKAEIDSLRSLNDVTNVHLTYYSLEADGP